MNHEDLIVPRMAFKIKDAGLFLGVLYLVSFLLLLPFYLRNTGNILSGAELMLIAILSIVLVQVFLNWLYILIIHIPFIMAAIIGTTGLIIFVFSPLLIIPVELIQNAASMFIGGSFLGNSLTLLSDFTYRLGQGMMIVAGVIWWLVEKAKNINYAALSGYLIGLAGLGIIAGISNFSSLLVFLTIWAVVYLKVSGNENIPDLRIIFKLVATVAVVFGMFKISVVSEGKGFMDTVFYFSQSDNIFKTSGYHNFLRFYEILLAVFFLLGIWKPGAITGRLPQEFRDKVFEFVKKGAGAMIDLKKI